ncbi:arabinogalactan peptide 20 [Phtheirospermum japonicum]|uniref:Arabinogalactan peptide 20 n=1 Tax=Phtheirospermum japonicum TaxID=374723 RepID=A0A830BKG5_9LAMI|nr:arabinogalactan peptide 20 [Phtheirospermum japonicum]
MSINCKVSFGIIATFALVFAIFMPAVQGQGYGIMAPAPAPASDGTAIDQGIAYGLMLLALVLTYLIHSFDAPLSI